MKKKTQYRIRNWREYNTALINRGSLTRWIDEEALNAWCYTGPAQRGAQYVYVPKYWPSSTRLSPTPGV